MCLEDDTAKQFPVHSMWCDYLFFQTTQLRSELVSCTEERDYLDQSLCQWREKVDSLEKTNCDTRNLISILEDDIRTGRKQYEDSKTSMEKVKTERHQVRTVILDTAKYESEKKSAQVCHLV